MNPPGLDALYRNYLYPDGAPPVSFDAPPGEPALVPAGSVSWRVFSNPVSLFVGGVLAVILELALPRVRHGVWDHSTFERAPRERLQRTGLAAMVTIYGPAGQAERMIEGITRQHARVTGTTPDGEPYSALDEDLLTWVQATAAFGFGRAYDALVRPLSEPDWDALFAEGAPVARLYGTKTAPTDRAGWQALLERTAPDLEPSETLTTFLRLMRGAPVLPAIARPLQAPLVRVACSLLPEEAAGRLGLPARASVLDRTLARAAAAAAGRIVLPSNPAVQSCRRLGLPADVLYGGKTDLASPQGKVPASR